VKRASHHNGFCDQAPQYEAVKNTQTIFISEPDGVEWSLSNSDFIIGFIEMEIVHFNSMA
jgi:hypothetical protein